MVSINLGVELVHEGWLAMWVGGTMGTSGTSVAGTKVATSGVVRSVPVGVDAWVGLVEEV